MDYNAKAFDGSIVFNTHIGRLAPIIATSTKHATYMAIIKEAATSSTDSAKSGLTARVLKPDTGKDRNQPTLIERVHVIKGFRIKAGGRNILHVGFLRRAFRGQSPKRFKRKPSETRSVYTPPNHLPYISPGRRLKRGGALCPAAFAEAGQSGSKHKAPPKARGPGGERRGPCGATPKVRPLKVGSRRR